MRTITRMIRYILISLLTMAIFFIALCLLCVARKCVAALS